MYLNKQLYNDGFYYIWIKMIKETCIKLYSAANKILFTIGFKLDYIWPHKFIWIKKMGIKTILDIGANRWQSIDRRSSLLWKNIIFHCFEPLHNPFRDLKKKYEWNKNIHLHNIWLGDNNNSKDMCVLSSDDSSSLLTPTKNIKETYQMDVEKQECVEIKTLDSIRDNLWIEWPILMKVDVQWFEDKVFEGAKRVLKEIDIIVVELSFKEFYEGQPLFEDVYKQLLSYWFKYCWSFEQSWDPKNWKPIQQDAIFSK